VLSEGGRPIAPSTYYAARLAEPVTGCSAMRSCWPRSQIRRVHADNYGVYGASQGVVSAQSGRHPGGPLHRGTADEGRRATRRVAQCDSKNPTLITTRRGSSTSSIWLRHVSTCSSTITSENPDTSSASLPDILAAVAGFVFVASRDGHSPVPQDDVVGLVRAYQDVRGDGEVDVASVGEHLHCATISQRSGSGIRRQGAAWWASVGVAHGIHANAPLGALDGQFAAVRHDTTGQVQLFNDPFGMVALYICERGGRIYASTSATALARHLHARADPVGAAVFLRTGMHFGPVSHWQGIRRLDPATVLTFSGGDLTETTYWRPIVDPDVRGMSFAATVDHCAHAVLSTIDQRLTNQPCLQADLTGGFDSRLVTAALARLGVRFTAHTSGETETVDVRLAREVARAGGFQWHQEALPRGWRPNTAELRSAMGWGDGSLEVLQLAEVLLRQDQRGRRCELLVTGGGGEHFGPYPWMQEFLRAGRSPCVNFDNLMSMRVLTPIDLTVLRMDPTPATEEYARDVLGRWANQYADELNTTQLDAIYAYKSVGHFGAYRSASEAFVRSEIPCYYKRVFTAGLSANHRFRNGHRLHRAVIGLLNPSVGAVETERGGPALRMRPLNAHRFVPYYWRLGRTAARKVYRRRAPQQLETAAMAGYRAAVRTLRADGFFDPATMRSGELYDTSRLSTFLDRAEQPNSGVLGMLGRIITLELGLQAVDGAAASSFVR
jgi:hypothetical protein